MRCVAVRQVSVISTGVGKVGNVTVTCGASFVTEYLRDPELSIDTFRRQLKTFLLAQYRRRHSSALETFVPSRSINLLFTLHLQVHYIVMCIL